MDNDKKVIFGFLAVVFVILVAGFMMIYFGRQKERKYRQVVESELKRINENNEKLGDMAKKLEGVYGEMLSQIQAADRKAEIISVKFRDEQAKSGNLASELKEKVSQIDVLTAEVNRYKTEKTELEKKMTLLHQEYGILREELARSIKATADSEEGLRKVEEKVDTLSQKAETTSLGTIILKK